MNSLLDIYREKLKESGHSNTNARKAVFLCLTRHEHMPLSMADLVSETKGSVDRASVYRAVELLERTGIIKRINIGWKYKLELGDAFHRHHHHITCSNCRKVTSTHDNGLLEQAIVMTAHKYGYSVTDHQIEILGNCPDCQNKSS